jgi:hypothetical protein
MSYEEIDEPFDSYEPTEEEKREIEDILNDIGQLEDSLKKYEGSNRRVKNRLFFLFNSEDHWKGWLKTNGIQW